MKRKSLAALTGSVLVAVSMVSSRAFADSSFVFCTGQTNGTTCDDGNPCTAGETCQAETCVPPETLALGSTIAVGSGPRSVVSGDWNGDGIVDLAIANRTSNNVTILKGDGSGGFVVVGSHAEVLALGQDWNTFTSTHGVSFPPVVLPPIMPISYDPPAQRAYRRIVNPELTADRVDFRNRSLTFRSLKKRRQGVYRSVPVPEAFLDVLDPVHGIREGHAKGRLWG